MIVPSYYTQFRCLADRCRHSCCIGWEIDVDADTYAWYAEIDPPFGDRLREGIMHGETPSFRLTHDERCTFLRPDGLCEIICTLGEDALCDICAEHPRFYTENGGVTHGGLGMCCEEACRLILTEPPHFYETETGQAVAVKAELPAADNRTPAEWAELYRNLERLDTAWDAYLDRLAACVTFAVPSHIDPAVWERLTAYFVFRHTAAHAAFCAHAVRVIQTLCTADTTFAELCEICRLYSAEIEYSDINLDVLYEKTAEA